MPLLASIFIFFVLRKLGADRKAEQEISSVKVSKADTFDFFKIEFSEKRFAILKFIGILASLVVLCFSGTIYPSPINFIYFLSFMTFATILSVNRNLFQKFAISLRIISIVMLLQITLIVIAQSPWTYSFIEGHQFIMNMMGFERILIIDDKENFAHFDLNEGIGIDALIHPTMLVIAYYVLTTTSNYILVSLKLLNFTIIPLNKISF